MALPNLMRLAVCETVPVQTFPMDDEEFPDDLKGAIMDALDDDPCRPHLRRLCSDPFNRWAKTWCEEKWQALCEQEGYLCQAGYKLYKVHHSWRRQFRLFCNLANMPLQDDDEIALLRRFGATDLTEIPDSAFRECLPLDIERLPSTITRIGTGAFRGCIGIKIMRIPKSVNHIGEAAFQGCSALEGVHLPKNDDFKKISQFVFAGCDKLTVLNIPKSVVHIEPQAFRGCKKLEFLDIPNSVNRIDAEAFRSCRALKHLILPTNDDFKKMSRNLLDGCTALTHLDIPKSVNEIGDYALYDCSAIEVLRIPDSVSVIGRAAFRGMHNLQFLILPENPGFTAVPDEMCHSCKRLESIVIPDSVTEIGAWAFAWCESLEEIHLPEEQLQYTGELQYVHCPKLKIYWGDEEIPMDPYWNKW